ncbi:hypothetical protein DIPPA_13522 [Diplonema papillatum]|nr:hypothetical protein DIPPA_13522 [Diplonema papillatum]
MVGPPARTRQTQVHSNPFHISNTNVRSVRGSASKRLAAKSPVSSSRRSATAEPERTEKPPSRAQAATPERPAPPRELPEGGAVPNAIDFRSLAIETTEDDQLQKENRMLRWKVQQLTATGELYRRKVCTSYPLSPTRRFVYRPRVAYLD